MAKGRIKEILIGREKGNPRESIKEGFFQRDFGLRGDIYGGPGDKQVGFLRGPRGERSYPDIRWRDYVSRGSSPP